MVVIDASIGVDLLSGIDLSTAVSNNAQYESTLWPGYRAAIALYYLRYRIQTPTDEQFAQAVARWQSAVGGLTINGILGPKTWTLMRPRGEPDVFMTPSGVVRPSGLANVQATFGDVSKPGFEATSIVRASAPAGLTFEIPVSGGGTVLRSTMRVHRLLKDEFESIFAEIAAAGLWSTLQTVGGVFYPRPVTGGLTPSMHWFGIAIDVNSAASPRGQTVHLPNPGIVQVLQDHGFHWGAFFPTPDPMHFQYATMV